MSNRRASRKRKTGLAPGTPIYIGEARQHEVLVEVTDYNDAQMREITGLDAATPQGRPLGVRWVDVDGVHQVPTVTTIGERFALHPLLIEDVLNPSGRPKLEEYDQHLFFVFKAFHPAEDEQGFHVVPEQISMVLGRGWVITFQELPGDTFDTVHTRMREGRGRIRKSKADYLAYTLLDATVDRYFEVLDRIAELVDELEREVLLGDPDQVRELPPRIHLLRQELQKMRKHVVPLASAISLLERGGNELVTEETRMFVRDVADHVAQVLDQIEQLREALSDLLNAQLALSSQKIGEVTKVLTVVSAIFIPLTFIVGVYGMNFDYMPELHWRAGYLLTWIIMGVVTIAQIFYFRRQRWL